MQCYFLLNSTSSLTLTYKTSYLLFHLMFSCQQSLFLGNLFWFDFYMDTLCHWQGGNLNHPLLITTLCRLGPKINKNPVIRLGPKASLSASVGKLWTFHCLAIRPEHPLTTSPHHSHYSFIYWILMEQKRGVTEKIN